MEKKKLLLIVSASIGVSNLDTYLYYLKEFYDISVILSKNSKQFIDRKLITYFCNKVYDNMFMEEEVPHVVLPYQTDLVVVLPATANIIGKIANGIADDLPTASVLNFDKKIIFFPNMNGNMWKNPIVQRNVSVLEDLGHKFVFEIKKTYEVGLKRSINDSCSIPQPQLVVKHILELEKFVLEEGH